MSDRRARDGRGATGWPAALGAVAAIALAVGSWWSGPPTPDPVADDLECPTSYPGTMEQAWVPGVGRMAGFDPREQLVPSTTPRAALVCWYSGGRNAEPEAPPVPLTGGMRLAGRDLEPLAVSLSRVRPDESDGCTDMGGQVTHQLLALDYPDGQVWVSVPDEPNGCVDGGNGLFDAPGWVGKVIHRSVIEGRWCTTSAVPGRALESCASDGEARTTDLPVLVPDRTTRVLVTELDDTGVREGMWPAERGPLVLDGAERDELLSALRALDDRRAPAPWQCRQERGVSYRITLVLDDGSTASPIEVRDDGCPFGIGTFRRAAEDGGELYDRLGRLMSEVPRVR